MALITHRVSFPILFGQHSDGNYSLSQVIEPHYDLVKTSTINIKMNSSLFSISLQLTWYIQMIEMSLFHLPVIILACICIVLPFGTKVKWPWSIGMLFSLGYPIASAIEIGFWKIPTNPFLFRKVFPPMIRCHFMDQTMVVGHLLALIITLTIKDIVDRKVFTKTIRNHLIPLGLVFFSGISFPILAKSCNNVCSEQAKCKFLKEKSWCCY